MPRDLIKGLLYQDGYDAAMADAAASVQVMDRKIADARRMLTAAAVSASDDLVVHDGAMARVDLYETIIERDEANACLRIRVRPTTR